MAIGADAAVWFFGTADDLSTTATTATVATTAISTAASLDEWSNDDDSMAVAFLLEVDDWSGAPTAGETIDLYCSLVSVNGANDEPVIDASYAGHYIGSFLVDAASAAQYLVLGPTALPVLATSQEYQFYVINNTSVTMGSTTDKWRLKVTPMTYGPHA